MHRRFYFVALVASLATPAVAQHDVSDVAARFAAMEAVKDISLSPEGSQVALVAPRSDGGENVVVIDLKTGGAKAVLSASGVDQQISYCHFVLEDRLVCSLYFRQKSNGVIEQASRLVTVGTDGGEMKMLTARETSRAEYSSAFGGSVIDYNAPDDPEAVLVTRYTVPENTTGTILSRNESGLGVEEVNLKTLKRKRVIAPRDSAVRFISDGHGHPRMMVTQAHSDAGYAGRAVNYYYRQKGGEWSQVSSVSLNAGVSKGFEPVAFDSEKELAYGFASNGDFQGLFSYDLTGDSGLQLVLGRDDADVDSLIRIGRNQRIVGASYATEKRRVEYFDADLRKLASALSNALDGMPISIVDADESENKLIVFAGSDTDPGDFYLYDRATGKLGLLMPDRPELAGLELSPMKPVSFPATDGTMIPGYLTLPKGSEGKNLPAIVMPHGGPAARDEWGFDWLVQFFTNRGYAVLQPNFRGSSGYGTAWFKKNGFQSWDIAIGDVNDAGRWLIEQGIAAPDKLGIFGWSYGGYAALQSAVVDPELYQAIVAVAPVTDLDRLREDARTSSDFRIVENFIGTGPHVESGSPARHANAFDAPVLLFHGTEDTNVDVGQSRLMRDRLESAGKPVNYVEFEGLAHSLQAVEARKSLLTKSDAFFRKAFAD